MIELFSHISPRAVASLHRQPGALHLKCDLPLGGRDVTELSEISFAKKFLLSFTSCFSVKLTCLGKLSLFFLFCKDFIRTRLEHRLV